MTTVVVVRKAGQVTIATDSLVIFGDTRLAHGHEDNDKQSFAPGAMYASFERAKSAREVAEIGVHAGCEFDKNSAGPIKAQTIKLKTKD
jgi:ATP-dependent protease HslVU (ClpYQ) peptidase subunit